MKALSNSFKFLVFSTLALAGLTVSAVEQSYAVKCRYFEGENRSAPLRDGDMLTQTVGDISSIRLRAGEAEMNITVRGGFEESQRGSEPTVQAIELKPDYSSKFILFYRNAVAIQYKDHLGKPTAVLSCQSNELPKIADRFLGNSTNETGVMEASFNRVSGNNSVVTTPAAPASPVATATVPVAPPVIVPSNVAQPITMTNGLPAGMAENLEFLQGKSN